MQDDLAALDQGHIFRAGLQRCKDATNPTEPPMLQLLQPTAANVCSGSNFDINLDRSRGARAPCSVALCTAARYSLLAPEMLMPHKSQCNTLVSAVEEPPGATMAESWERK